MPCGTAPRVGFDPPVLNPLPAIPKIIIAYSQDDEPEEGDGHGKVKEAAAFRLILDRRSRSPKFGKDGIGVPVGIRCRDAGMRLNDAGGLAATLCLVLGGNFAFQPREMLPQEIALPAQLV
jgi:hypothetical protein